MISEFLNQVDFEKTDVLLKGFNESTGFAAVILDLNGNILSQSELRAICSDFYRKNPETASNCFVCDSTLSISLDTKQKHHFYKCKNGLINLRLPIVIRGEHIANLFSGQFFFEEPDISIFRNQITKYGFDENSYLEALSKVPIVSKDKVIVSMDFLLSIFHMIIDMTIDKIEHLELSESINESKESIRVSEQVLIKSQIHLKQNVKDLLESQRIARLGTWRLDLATNEVVWSEELYKMYGFDPTIPPPDYTEHMKLFTPESWERLSTALEKTRTTGVPYELELERVAKEGSNGWMWVRGEAEKDSEGNIISLWGAAQDITKYKRTELEVKQSEERFQLLFNQAPIGYQSLDFDGHFIEVNQQWLDTLGFSKEEVIGKWFGDFLCAEYVEGFRKRFPLFKSQGYIHSEFEMMTKDGNRLFMAFEGKIGYDTDGKFKQTHCVLQDITNQRKAEKALIESKKALQMSEERFRVAQEISPDGFTILHPERNEDGEIIDFTFVYENHAIASINHTDPTKVIGKSLLDLFPSHRGTSTLDSYIHVANTGELQVIEEINIGNLVSNSRWLRLVIISMGEEIAILAQDISKRKNTELELEKTMAQNQRILDNLQDSYFQTDSTGKFTIVNPQAVSMYGFSFASELIGQSAEILYDDPDDRKKILDELRNNGAVTDLVIKAKRKDGETFWASIHVQYVKDEDGTVIGTEGLVRDISERIKLRREIELQRDNLVLSNQKLAHLFKQSVQSISKIGELRDAYTAGHQRRVTELSCAIAKQMGLSDDSITNITYGSLIHDIGKIYVPSEILNKPGIITNLEFQIIKSHVEHGYNITKEIDFPDAISTMIYQHHERLDGSGYPQGLIGEQIIIESRILAVSDVVEAMTSHRPYRPALGINAALEEISKFRGQKYDIDVVDTCILLFRENGFSFDDSI